MPGPACISRGLTVQYCDQTTTVTFQWVHNASIASTGANRLPTAERAYANVAAGLRYIRCLRGSAPLRRILGKIRWITFKTGGALRFRLRRLPSRLGCPARGTTASPAHPSRPTRTQPQCRRGTCHPSETFRLVPPSHCPPFQTPYRPYPWQPHPFPRSTTPV